MAVVGEHPNELVRDQYVMEVADRCGSTPTGCGDCCAGRAGAPPAPRGGADAARPAARPGTARRGHAAGAGGARASPSTSRETVPACLDEALFTDRRSSPAYRAAARPTTLHEAVDAAEPRRGRAAAAAGGRGGRGRSRRRGAPAGGRGGPPGHRRSRGRAPASRAIPGLSPTTSAGSSWRRGAARPGDRDRGDRAVGTLACRPVEEQEA